MYFYSINTPKKLRLRARYTGSTDSEPGHTETAPAPAALEHSQPGVTILQGAPTRVGQHFLA
jgi:hypothetical protein